MDERLLAKVGSTLHIVISRQGACSEFQPDGCNKQLQERKKKVISSQIFGLSGFPS